MSACSSPDLEPGPLEDLDPAAFVGPLEPPVFTPLAQEFASHNAAWLSTLDSSIALLDAETAIDVGGDILSGISAVASSHEAAVNPEALANLQAAEAGFSAARDKTASLESWLPPDVQHPTHVSPIVFRITDPAGQPIVGAVITLDQDTGRGTTFATDSTGAALVEIVLQSTVSYSVTAPGFVAASGVTTGLTAFSIVRITLQAA